MADEERPIFSAVSSSARQLFLLLRCVSFAPSAQVQISDEGLRFSVEESGVMEGMVFLEKTLFTSYQFNGPTTSSPNTDSSEHVGSAAPMFTISLLSLLETLQLFGLTADNSSKTSPFSRDSYTHAFSNQVLGVSGLCRLGYEAPGAPFTVILEEHGIKTVCELNTYEPVFLSDIPFSREDIVMKVIMRASYLLDAIDELGTSNPQVITLAAQKRAFTVSASSPLGSAVVEFHRDAKASRHKNPTPRSHDDDGRGQTESDSATTGLLETFLLAPSTDGAFSQSYKFAHVAAIRKALQSAIKVSVRADHQGVLSLQFMIENLEGGGVSFVDFRFVPLLDDEGERVAPDDSEDDDDEEPEEE
ncbi:uncharacterized protein PV09_06447 [Verruconis gallopava]|uniref:Uncharacterized protein n=1 Tax=Verruconis gallopava TaxID=253628 RepID=A0A0D2A6T8_9PEZI|nr:uncharacterized protein PV09_06447 [Verruconis gallopava]KIW02300.1 hypothetical protein PV09_06447 [Verruconis gallopava]